MKVFWTEEAERDRLAIWSHVAADNPRAAANLDLCFAQAASTLAVFPRRGRLGKVPGTRELLPHGSYRLVYEIEHDTVWILAVVHTLANGRPSRNKQRDVPSDLTREPPESPLTEADRLHLQTRPT